MYPIPFHWNGEVMLPVSKRLTEQLVPGQNYLMEVMSDRSAQDHRHYFAALNEAWANLPEMWNGRWSSPDRLRKWALIQAGFCHTTVYRARTRDEAERYIKSMLEWDDEAEVERIRTRVIIKRAKSQSYSSMSKKEFRESKDAVLAVVSTLIGIGPGTLKREAGNHA